MNKFLPSNAEFNKLQKIKYTIKNHIANKIVKQYIWISQSPFTGHVYITFKGDIKFKIRQRIFRDMLRIRIRCK